MNLPNEIITFILALLPITELRASIPLAISVYGLTPTSAFIWSVLGNIVISFLLLWLLGPLTSCLIKKAKWIKRLVDWIFERTRNKASAKFIKYGQWALILFVAIPLPGTGAWTGSLVAFLFNIPKWSALLLITIGVLISGVVVTLATMGIISSISIFNY